MSIMDIRIPLSELLQSIDDPFELKGEEAVHVTGFASVSDAKSGDLTFLQEKKYLDEAKMSKASIMLVPRNLDLGAIEVPTLVLVENPTRTLSKICGIVEKFLFPLSDATIHASSVVEEDAQLGSQVSVGAHSFIGSQTLVGDNTSIGHNVTVGDNCTIGCNVLIDHGVTLAPHTVIGDFCRISSGVVIGASGFGYDFNKQTGSHERIPQIGRVVVGKHVDIGANSTIDRARMGETRIGDGTKIDNLVQIGHNVVMGNHCIVCGQAGISGSAKLGDFVVLGGQAGIRDHIEIASGTQIGGQAGVSASVVKPGSKLYGSPAVDYGLGVKIALLNRKLPDLFKRFSAMERRMEKLD
jgi:UDP-3-O-[3-hydroxymyristoyl] glucosamine N-acyltransferase